jgi:hypothetical protein
MKHRTRIIYNCFDPDFDNDYDTPVVCHTLRAARRLILDWSSRPDEYGTASMARVVRHPRLDLAAAYWVVPAPRFDARLISRRKRKARGSSLVRIHRAYYAKNVKADRGAVVGREALREEKYRTDADHYQALLEDDLPF